MTGAVLAAGCTRPVSVSRIVGSPSDYLGKTVSLRDVPISHYFWLPDLDRGAYEIGSGSNIWVVTDRTTPRTGDTINITGAVADNYSLGDYYLGLVIVEKSRRLIYDYPEATAEPVPTHPPSPPQIERVPTQVNFFTRPGADPPAEELRLALRNEASPEWSVRVDQPWLKVSPTGGSLAEGVNRVAVQAEAAHFPIGRYDATITVRIETVDREVPVRLYVTDAHPGQSIEASMAAGTGNAWAAGIRLDSRMEASVGILEKPLFAPSPDKHGLAYDAGDMAVFVKGTLVNDTGTEWQIDYWPEAFDAAGNRVAWGLDMSGVPLAGHLQMNIAAHSSRPFVLHLTWAEGIARITINANKYDAYPPLP